MASIKIISTLALAGALAASASTAAIAGDHSRHHQGAAIAAGILGAVVIGSLIANAHPAQAAPPSYYPPQPYYEEQPQAYYPQYPQAPVQQVYYGSAPQYQARQPGFGIHISSGRSDDRHADRGYRQIDYPRRYSHHYSN